MDFRIKRTSGFIKNWLTANSLRLSESAYLLDGLSYQRLAQLQGRSVEREFLYAKCHVHAVVQLPPSRRPFWGKTKYYRYDDCADPNQ